MPLVHGSHKSLRRRLLLSPQFDSFEEFDVQLFFDLEYVGDGTASALESEDLINTAVNHFCKAVSLTAIGDIVSSQANALNASISIEDFDGSKCRIVDTSRIYDPEAEDIFGEGFLLLQVQVSQKVNITSMDLLSLEQVTSTIESGFGVATGGQSKFRILLHNHPMFRTVMVVKVRRSLSAPQIPPSPLPTYSSHPTPARTMSIIPSLKPSVSPSLQPSELPFLTPGNRLSIEPTHILRNELSFPSSQPSIGLKNDPSLNDSNLFPQNNAASYNLGDDPLAIAAIVGGAAALLFSCLCILWINYHRRKIGPRRLYHRTYALSTRDGQTRVDRRSIVPEIVQFDKQSLSDTFMGELTSRRVRRKMTKQAIQPLQLAGVDSIDETSLYTTAFSQPTTSTPRQSNLVTSVVNSSVDNDVQILSPLSDSPRAGSTGSVNNVEKRIQGPIDVDTAKAYVPQTDENKTRSISEALEQDECNNRWGYGMDHWSYKSDGSASKVSQSHSSCKSESSSRKSEASRSSYKEESTSLSRTKKSPLSQDPRNLRIESIREDTECKLFDRTESSSMIVSHISDKDFTRHIMSPQSLLSSSAASKPSLSISSKSSWRIKEHDSRQVHRYRGFDVRRRRDIPEASLADFLDDTKVSDRKEAYRRTSTPSMNLEVEELEAGKKVNGLRKGEIIFSDTLLPDAHPCHSSRAEGSSRKSSQKMEASSQQINEISLNSFKKIIVETVESSENESAKSGTNNECDVSLDSFKVNVSNSSPIRLGEGVKMNTTEASTGDSHRISSLNSKAIVIFSKDDGSISSDSTGKSPGTWLFDTVEKTLGPRSVSADMESLCGSVRSHSQHSSSRSASRRNSGKFDSVAPHVLEHEMKRLEVQLAALDNEQMTISSVRAGTSVAGTSFCTIRPRNKAAKVSRKNRTVLLVPPGKLGIVLANRQGGNGQGGKGTVIAEIRSTSVLKGMLSQGDRLIAVDGEDVSGMLVSQITSLMASNASRERRLTLLTSVVSKQN
jgi:hypothetical protein